MSDRADQEQESERDTSPQITGPRLRQSEPLDLPAGTEVGRFAIERKIGEGGMGVVFLAVDRELERQVALKLLRTDLDELPPFKAQRRMLREARAMAAVSHPNLVVIYEAGVYQEHVYLAMEYVPGVSLGDWLAERERSLAEIIDVFEQVGSALAELHEAGIVHRDFKPENVLVDSEGHASLLDLGIARRLPLPQEVTSSAVEILEAKRTGAGFESLTDSLAGGAPIGTPDYMSPEQLLGADVEPTSDQFSFGLVLYEALCGRPPFAGQTELETISDTIAGQLRPWGDAEVPERLRPVIERMLSGQPEARYPTMVEALEAIRQALGVERQLRVLTDRWLRHGRHADYLLPGGDLLDQGRALVEDRPEDVDGDALAFVKASHDRASSRRLQRRALIGSVAALGLGLGPVLYLLRSRTRQLEAAARSRVSSVVDRISQQVDEHFAESTETLRLMLEQREVWMPDIERLHAEGEVGDPAHTAALAAATRDLNRYFRPVLRRSPTLSSLMVATETFEFLAFDDLEGEHLEGTHFYNRVVRTEASGSTAFQLFSQSDGSQRTTWLRPGEEGVLGERWEGYDPGGRVFVDRAAPEPEVGWTEPYLFFITKEAGLTGSSRFEHEGESFVLAVDVTLTDLSAITSAVEVPTVRAVVLTRGDEVVALPKDPRFADREAVRRFFASFDPDRSGDEAAVLPRLMDLARPRLVGVWSEIGDQRAGVHELELEGEELWVGVRSVGSPEQNLTVLVVAVPEE